MRPQWLPESVRGADGLSISTKIGDQHTRGTMAYQWLTADLHLGHANICIYSNRPFIMPEDLGDDGFWVSREAATQCAERMNDGLIARWNERVSPEDTVYHLGDFINRGFAKKVAGLRDKASDYEARLNGRIVHILGNHDRNNGLTRGLESATIKAGGKIFLLKHHPVYDPNVDPPCNAVMCGHVHDNWDHKWEGGMLFINVGVDVRSLRPVRLDEASGLFHKLTNERDQKS